MDSTEQRAFQVLHDSLGEMITLVRNLKIIIKVPGASYSAVLLEDTQRRLEEQQKKVQDILSERR